MAPLRLIGVFVLFAINASTAAAQLQPTAPDDSSRPVLSLFLDSSTLAVSLANSLQMHEPTSVLAGKCNVHIFTPDDPIYQAQWAGVVRQRDFPAAMLQAADGGVIYLAGGENLPTPGDKLYNEMRTFYRAYQAALTEQRTQSPSEDCPDGICPTPTPSPRWPSVTPSTDRPRILPKLFDETARRITGPVSDTISAGVWMIVLFIIGTACLLLFLAVLIVVAFFAFRSNTPRLF